jgi:hypothetical protein
MRALKGERRGGVVRGGEPKQARITAPAYMAPDGAVPGAHRRYHDAQADPNVDTAAKRLARSADVDYVTCGCGDRFPSAAPESAGRRP